LDGKTDSQVSSPVNQSRKGPFQGRHKPIGILPHFRDKNSRVFKQLGASKGCRDKCDISCFKSLDHANTSVSHLKIKESFYIEQFKPELNKQVEHINLSLHF